MSVSVHMNGRKRAEMKKPLKDHQERKNKKDGKEAAKHSDSAIDENLTAMNVSYISDEERFPKMRKKLDVINEKRIENGQRKIRKDANILMAGTLQISDDSLEALGWKSDENGKKLPSNQQSEQALNNVKVVYQDMFKSIQSQPEIYGDVFSATLHLDESSPHVDFMSDPLSVENINQTARDFLNGKKGTPKGEKLRDMQDNIMAKSQLKKDVIDAFGLVRGDSFKSKVDKVKTIKKDEKKIDVAQKSITQAASNIQIEVEKLGSREKGLEKKEQEMNVKTQELKNYIEVAQKEREQVKEERTLLEKAKQGLDNVFDKLELLLEKAKSQPRTRRLINEIREDHTPLTKENVDSFSDEINNLSSVVLTDEDLKGIESKDDGMSL
jgi:hypothetical protein